MLNEQETAGWVISGVENQLCSLPCLVVLKSPWPCRRVRPDSSLPSPWPRAARFTCSPFMQPRSLSDKRWSLGGNNILHIISWGHSGHMAMRTLFLWFITVPVIPLWWMANGSCWTQTLLSKDAPICTAVRHSSTLAYCVGGTRPLHF